MCRWEDNIEIDLKIVWVDEWIDLAENMDHWRAFVDMAMKLMYYKMREFLNS